MNETERNDLLIKIGVQSESMNQRLLCIEKELKKRQCMLHQNQIATIERDFNAALCSQNTEKIKTVERLTWAALLTGLSLVMKSFVDAFSK